MKQLIIEDYRIDLNRSEVHWHDKVESLEPKVLEVLICLIKNQGEVVSHKSLLEQVWPGTIVEANALQRCIGQLRRTFNDDAKQQRVIATFPKKGYSLVAKVQPVENTTQSASTNKKTSTRALLTSAAVLAASLVLALGGYLQNSNSEASYSPLENNSNVFFEQEDNSTAQNSFYALYSPNGRFLAYPKLAESNTGNSLRHLWLQDLSNREEFQLSQAASPFIDMAWSPNSQQLAFVESACNPANCSANNCFKLQVIAIAAINNDGFFNAKETVIDCKEDMIQSPQWVSQDSLVYINNSQSQSSLSSVNISSGDTQDIYRTFEQRLQHLIYSANINSLAMSVRTQKDQQKILLIDLATNNQTLITPEASSLLGNETWFLTWNLDHNGILVSTSDGMINIDFNGVVTKQTIPYIPSAN